MSKPLAHERLAQAAFALFDERGYEQTTVDDIAERAGLSRATFFRLYRSKEDVIFPDHDLLLSRVRDRLRSSSHGTALAAVSDAVRLVLLQYLDEGDVARRRYALTSTVAALRDREIVSVARYQRLFREFIAEWMGDHGQSASLQAELMAAAVVSAHNHVLRRWLRGESPDPVREVDEAMRQVIALFAPRLPDPDAGGTAVVAFRTSQPLEALLPVIQQALGGQPLDVMGQDERPAERPGALGHPPPGACLRGPAACRPNAAATELWPPGRRESAAGAGHRDAGARPGGSARPAGRAT